MAKQKVSVVIADKFLEEVCDVVRRKDGRLDFYPTQRFLMDSSKFAKTVEKMLAPFGEFTVEDRMWSGSDFISHKACVTFADPKMTSAARKAFNDSYSDFRHRANEAASKKAAKWRASKRRQIMRLADKHALATINGDPQELAKLEVKIQKDQPWTWSKPGANRFDCTESALKLIRIATKKWVQLAEQYADEGIPEKEMQKVMKLREAACANYAERE